MSEQNSGGPATSQSRTGSTPVATNGANEFELGFRLVEREIFGFYLRSSGGHRWVAVSIMVMAAVSLLLVALWPYANTLLEAG